MSRTLKIIIVIVAIVVVGYGGYLLFSSGKAGQSSVAVASDSSLSREESLTNKQFLQLLRSLTGINLKESEIFQNPAFANLSDFSVELTPESAGRENPFAPLEGKSRASVTSQSELASPSRAVAPPAGKDSGSKKAQAPAGAPGAGKASAPAQAAPSPAF